MTAPPVEHRERPYDDGFIDGGFLRYRYLGTDPHHRDNVGLRTAMQRQTPLIYLHGTRRWDEAADPPLDVVA